MTIYKKQLYKALTDYKKLNRSSFHTPGHKNNCSFIEGLLSLDFTELDDTDSLFESSGAILESENKAASVFNTQKALFSAGGCTLCIQAMLKLVSKPFKKVICSRIIHKSAINTMALLNLEPIFLNQLQDKKTGFLMPVSPLEIEDTLKNDSGICAVYLTSPDYFGVISDIKSISKICKKYEVPLIVDNAHGSHLAFLEPNLHPISCGADMCADSLHKTLPVLTGGALLHINNREFIVRAKSAMALFGSTSPSYPIMASLDLCCNWVKNNGKIAYKNLVDKLEPIKNIIKEKGFLVPNGVTDPTRISLNVKSFGISGKDFTEFLRTFGIEPELYTEDFVVLILTPFNTNEDILKLEKALINFNLKEKTVTLSEFFTGVPDLKISLNEAILSESEIIGVKDSVNRVSAATVCQCPPGIPILMPGEVIFHKHVDFLLNCGILFVEVIK